VICQLNNLRLEIVCLGQKRRNLTKSPRIEGKLAMNSMDTPELREIRARNAGQFTLTESIYPAGLRMPIHNHEPAYLSFLMKGAYTETSFKGTRTCKPSTLVFHPPDSRHAVDFHHADVRIFRVEIKSRWLDRMREYSGLEPTDARGGLTTSLSLRLYDEFRCNDTCSPLAIEGLMLEITAELARQRLKKLEQGPPRWLTEARDAVTANISEPPSLNALAQMVGVHPVSLAREFRRHYRCTIGEYIRQLRIDAACKELSYSETPLSTVATNAGFYDQSHFANTFRRYTGKTPTQYRAAERIARRESKAQAGHSFPRKAELA
jgi:AraC family transcriptional regulator